jgi:colicin import membrane protein
MSFLRQHKGSVLWSVALHIAIVAALGLTIRLPSFEQPLVAAAPIQGVLIDGAVIEREQKQRDDTARAERQRVERAERQRKEAAETAQREKVAAEKREQERIAEEKRLKEKQAQDRVAAEKQAEQERVAEQKRKEQEARGRAEREATAKREADAKRKQQAAEAELQNALAAEGERLEAQRNGQLDEYIRAIENAIVRRWTAPLSVKPGLECIVNVVQLPSGDVVDARVASCNGDEAVVRSIELAVRNASPLPKPPVPSLFERNLRVRFRPDL